MPVELITVPCLQDNYAFLLHDDTTGQTLLVDTPEAAPIQSELDKRGWQLSDIILTHHHWDHIDGLEPLRGNARVIGAKADAHRLPALDLAVAEGDTFETCGQSAQVFDVSGHTIGHIAVYLPQAGISFTADSLMALGCGRLFEGTPAQMWDSMQKLRALPDDTLICSGHEYTASNARFAAALDPHNRALTSRIETITADRAAGRATVPSVLGVEKATNPFLRADDAALMTHLGLAGADPAAVFAEIRGRKDRF